MTGLIHQPSVLETDLPLPGRRQGKVRDIYELASGQWAVGSGGETRASEQAVPTSPSGHSPPGQLLIVATDRISAFDVVMPTPIPGKGRLLTEMASLWFDFVHHRELAQTHLLSTDVDDLPEHAGLTREQHEMLRGRIMIVKQCRVVPVECVARGYLDGSGWSEYQATGAICGVKLPPGLKRGDRLPQPIFTPATKEALGKHDENITFDRACQLVGGEVMEQLRATTLSIYNAAHAYALEHGVILADTKFEFGWEVGTGHQASGIGKTSASPDAQCPVPDALLLVDEVLTPDSSRYWPLDTWKPGGEQVSYDKQYLREYLNALVAKGQWNKQPPGPSLPESVVEGTLARYREARERLFG